jgi:DNA-binding SARP family transcriptional activator
MEFNILGPLEVWDNGNLLPLGGSKQRALLAVLILHANEVVAADRLMEDLWGERQPTSGAKALHVYVSQLRKVIGENRVLTRAPGYMLHLDPEELDLTRFQRLREKADTSAPQEASSVLREAIALWRGAPLADVAYESFAQSEIARLEELRTTAIEQRIEMDLALGKHAELVGELDALVREHPLRERVRAQLMVALYRSGRQAEALDAYNDARQALVEELGIEPSTSLRELHQKILRQDPALELAPVTAPRTVFVGRDAELSELRAGLDDAIAGRGRLFLIGGEPGIGKSRLTDEVIVVAKGLGARVLVGRCWEAGGAPAYWPWVQSLRTYLRESETSTVESIESNFAAVATDLAQILPELRRHFPDVPEPAAVESEAARFRLFDATVQLLRNASQTRPMVFVIDDLHAADTPSLLLLQFLARELGSMRMLVLAAYRTVDPQMPQPVRDTLAQVVREPVARRIALSGLTKPAVAQYVELTASELASRELLGALYEQTEGNPLFVAETVRLLALEGLRRNAAGRIGIPQSVRDVIARRLAHLPKECNRVLILAAVIGREFSVRTLASLSGVSEDELLETVDVAMAARVVIDTPGASGRLRFAHVLIRDTLYDGLTSARRVLLHRQAIGVLRELEAEEPGQHLAELAHHAVAAREFSDAVDYARRAADHALVLLAYEEAARLYETALEALALSGAADREARCELLLALGEAEASAGNAERAKTAFLDAAEIARLFDLRRPLARAAAGYAREDMYLRAGADAQLVGLLEEALAALGTEDVELRARLLARLAGALRDEPARERRDTLSREAVELARASGSAVALAYALDGRAAAIIAPDTLEEHRALSTELREVAARLGDNVRLIHAHAHRLVSLIMLGGVADLEDDIEAMARAAADLRQPAELWDAYAGRAVLAIAAGRLADAEKLAAQALAVGEQAKPEVSVAAYWLQRHAIADLRGTLEEIEHGLRGVVAEYPARVAFRCALTHLDARLGRLSEAKRALDGFSKDRFAALPFDQEWLFGMSLLAETSAALSDAESAAVLYELLLPYAAFNAADWPEGMRGSVSRYLALLATTTGRWADAEVHFKAALAANGERGARTWLTHTQHDYAQLLLERAEPGDREQAAELLASAGAASREVGMAALADEIAALAMK